MNGSHLPIENLNHTALKKKPPSENQESDSISKLEELHKTIKRERMAWEKLIENLNELQIKNQKPQ